MNLKTEFTEPECVWFRQVCNFTPQELSVFDLRVKDSTIVQIQEKLNMSESTVNRRIKSIKAKIHKVL